MKIDQDMRVVTHSGPFHADDVISAVILRMAGFTGQFVRTRDPDLISKADIVFDVGFELDPVAGRFDHHQPGGGGLRTNGVPYASAGLIWREFGLLICRDLGRKHDLDASMLLEGVDQCIIQGIDALDSGTTVGGEYSLKDSGVKVEVKTFTSLISSVNPVSLIEGTKPDAFDLQFDVAVSLASVLFERLLLQEIGRLKAASLIHAMDTGSPVLELKEFCPWQDLVCRELPHVVFVVFRAPDGRQWNAQAVPLRLGTFENRKKFPESWAGLRGEKLAEVTGVPDAVFCHTGAFYCVAASREGANALARIALEA